MNSEIKKYDYVSERTDITNSPYRVDLAEDEVREIIHDVLTELMLLQHSKKCKIDE